MTYAIYTCKTYVIHSKKKKKKKTQLMQLQKIFQYNKYLLYGVRIALPEVSCSAVLLGSGRAKLTGLQVVRTDVGIKQET